MKHWLLYGPKERETHTGCAVVKPIRAGTQLSGCLAEETAARGSHTAATLQLVIINPLLCELILWRA